MTEIDNTPGILPFKIGDSHIVTSKHILLYDVDVTTLEEQILNLENTYKILNSSLYSKSEALFAHNLRSTYNHLFPLISEIISKFKNLKPSQITRKKRGLINAAGSVAKFLFGTLDASDIIQQSRL